jgi:hypothetical protein
MARATRPTNWSFNVSSVFELSVRILTVAMKMGNSVTIRACAAVTALLVIGATPNIPRAGANSDLSREYDIKAVFVSQLIAFVDGFRFQQKTDPNDRTGQPKDQSITIGIVGEDPFHSAFEPLLQRRVHERKIALKHFKGLSDFNRENRDVTLHPDVEEMKKCDVVFVCPSEQAYAGQILAPIRDERILTIADTPGFLEKGGIITLLAENHKIRFEISVVAAERAKLSVRSKLLRLAKRVVEEGDPENRQP